MGNLSGRRHVAGRVLDPVFLCMVGAVVLAVASSIALRAVVSAGGGAASAQASEHPQADQTPPVPRGVNQR